MPVVSPQPAITFVLEPRGCDVVIVHQVLPQTNLRRGKNVLLFGIRTRAKALAQVDRPCSKCSKPSIHTAVEAKRWCTLFFVPVIPLGTSYGLRCNLCGLKQGCSPKQAAQLAAKRMAAGAAR